MKKILILIILLVTLLAISHQIKCFNKYELKRRSPLRSFAIRPLKTIRDVLKVEELKEKIKDLVRAHEKTPKKNKNKIKLETIRKSEREMERKKPNQVDLSIDYGGASFFRKFFHYERI